MSKQLTFHKRRQAVAQISVWFRLSQDNLERFGKTSTELCRYTAAREHEAHMGLLQMHVQRAMYAEGMTDESGLCACLTFNEITSVGTRANILLFSDMTDLGGFHADFDHMIELLRRVASEQGFECLSHFSYVNPKYKEAVDILKELVNA